MQKSQAQFQQQGVRLPQTLRPSINASPVRQPLNQTRLPATMSSAAPKGKQRLDLKLVH